ncbi:MAG TPA: Spy/CpxP family protein refolding chaperone [Pyrinomonadaceae bacterium]|nr:Spy/CpxP family protein refolding chaperone [Pyrinomonadaceae bacterium]
MKLHIKSLVTVISLVILAALPLHAQTATAEQPAPPVQEKNFGGDAVRELNLTPEQREQIRMIREQSRAERAVVNRRVRETNRALEEALDSDNPDQSVLEQKIQEVSTAQAEAMRMRIVTEVKIRQVLTVEQRVKLKEMRRTVHQLRERRRVDGAERREQRLEQRTRRLERRRNRVPVPQENGDPQRPQEW